MELPADFLSLGRGSVNSSHLPPYEMRSKNVGNQKNEMQ